jgi:hypothetical protein
MFPGSILRKDIFENRAGQRPGEANLTRHLRFILLLPHRDCGKVLRAYSRRLFAGGFWGAYSFPSALPLGIVSRPFTRAELKELATALRNLTLARDGKIRTGLPVRVSPLGGGVPKETGNALSPEEAPGFTLFGPSLNLELPPEFPPAEIFRFRFSSPVLCAALIPRNLPKQAAPPPPSLSFRAAAVANMILRPLSGGDKSENFEGYSFEWKIGERVWLPAYQGPGKRVG